ncbi:MAG: alpha/beta hydrolase [Flavobacteriaceae bacterium]|nr:alpha/beta hydrolase [Flavobacteriaceae bacterium]
MNLIKLFRKHIFIGLVSILFFASCNKNSSNDLNLEELQEVEEIQIINDENSEIIFTNGPIELGNIQARFARNIAYDFNPNTVFDVFLPVSETPTELVIFIHGGGFLAGEKEIFYTVSKDETWNFPEHIKTLLSNNIAIANINYRVIEKNDSDGIIKSLNDSKRCLQFIRRIAEILNIDKSKIGLYGISAGGGTSLWLNFHDDMADSANSDIVLRESTKVSASAVLETQASYDLVKWADDIFEPYNLTFEQLLSLDEARVLSFFGVSTVDELYSPDLIAYRDNVNMLEMISIDDAEYWVSNINRPVISPTNVVQVTHHAFHAKTLKEYADNIGLPNVSYYGRNPILFEDPSNESAVDFLIRKLKE